MAKLGLKVAQSVSKMAKMGAKMAVLVAKITELGSNDYGWYQNGHVGVQNEHIGSPKWP